MSNQVEERVGYPIEWDFGSITSRYATNMVVQAGQSEFFLAFFELRPPLVFGPEDRNKISAVKAECIARVIVSKDQMQAFIDALQQNLDRVKEQSAEELENDDVSGAE